VLKAAQELYPQPEEGRRPFLERALALLEKRPPPLVPADLHLKGSIHRALGQPDEAVVAYRAALDQQPLELDWRYDHAEALFERGRFQESSQELRKIVMMQPEHGRARKLMDAANGKIAEG
jgi:tetratricopeptide (TPR) repeat protein